MRRVFRLFGFLLIAAGFVAAVMDGARSIARSALDWQPLGATAFRLLGERYLLLQPAIERHVHPLLWDPVVLNLTLLPTSLVLLALGFLFHRFGRPQETPIGHLVSR
jgi:hypothetical protein